MNKHELCAFEDDLQACFERGEIKAPLHLAGGNEEQLINIFRSIPKTDWVLCSWRAHYHCLLKGVPPAEVKAAILDGRSISLCFPEYKILSSGIVGGTAPMAVGIAMGIKRAGKHDWVNCFIGDMTARAGIVKEAMEYAAGHELPVRWIVEDNDLSVRTDTKEVWGPSGMRQIQYYHYNLTKPHVGTGKFVRF